MKTVYVTSPETEPNTRKVVIEVTLDNTDSEDVCDELMLEDAGFNEVQASYFILSSVPVSGVPSGIEIDRFPRPDLLEFNEDACFELGLTAMRDHLLPSLAALTAENKTLSEERGALSERVRLLEIELAHAQNNKDSQF